MWEEYAIPGLMITFILGVLLGINLGMLCIPRFFEPVGQRQLQQSFLMKSPQLQQHVPSSETPMRYPSGFTAKQLQQHDFTARRPPIGIGRRPNNGQFSY